MKSRAYFIEKQSCELTTPLEVEKFIISAIKDKAVYFHIEPFKEERVVVHVDVQEAKDLLAQLQRAIDFMEEK